MSERTLVLIKPDGVRRGLAGEVVSRIERKGLRIVAMDMRVVGRDLAETHYADWLLTQRRGEQRQDGNGPRGTALDSA